MRFWGSEREFRLGADVIEAIVDRWGRIESGVNVVALTNDDSSGAVAELKCKW